jgi:putative FmdB family regulatory protein
VPTYEYRCSAGHQYEKREGFDAPAKQKCEKCGKPASRVIFAPPIVFKGNGFYKTDNRAADSSSSASESTSSSESDSSTKTTTAAAASDHGHSHGPGGHSHGSSTDSSDSVESAAAS